MTQASSGSASTTEPGAIVFLKEDETGYSIDEVYALLSGDVSAMTAAANTHNGAMIAFIPATEFIIELALPGGEALDQLHCTAVFLGDVTGIDDETQLRTLAIIEELASRQPLIVGHIFSFSVFNPDSLDACVVAGLSGSDLEDAHDSVVTALNDEEISYPDPHEPWIPHITLQYDSEPQRLLTSDLLSKSGPIIFDRIRVAFGDVITDFPLRHIPCYEVNEKSSDGSRCMTVRSKPRKRMGS